MRDVERGFANLVEENPHRQAWLQERQEAIAFVRSLGEERVFEAIAAKLERALQETGQLPEDDGLMDLVHSVGVALGLSEGGVEMVRRPHVQTIAVSGALARVLGRPEADMERFSKVAGVETFLDVHFVADCLAHSDLSASWTPFLKKVRLSVQSINDDEYQAKDELARWAKEIARSVPAWRSGDYPRTGIAIWQLLSALLHALDEDAWLQFLDQLPLPALMEALLSDSDVEGHPVKLLDWLRRAPRAFEKDGSRTKATLVFVLERKAMSVLEEELMRRSRWGGDEEAGRKALSEVAQARRQLVAALRERVDAYELLPELAARCMSVMQSGEADSPRARLRRDFYRGVGLLYAEALGDPEQVLQHMRRREAADRSRSRWALWLVAALRAMQPEAEPMTPQRPSVLGSCWAWLVELLVDMDPGIAERYGAPAQWTEHLGGVALASLPDPKAKLEEAWEALAVQRLTPEEDRYAGTTWATSRFLARIAYFAYQAVDDEAAAEIWLTAMTMSITAWLLSKNSDSYAEVAYGLAHLARGRRLVPEEPRRTLEYLVGLSQEVNRSIILLLDNGMPPQEVLGALQGAGLDAGRYLSLNWDDRISEHVKKAREALGL